MSRGQAEEGEEKLMIPEVDSFEVDYVINLKVYYNQIWIRITFEGKQRIKICEICAKVNHTVLHMA